MADHFPVMRDVDAAKPQRAAGLEAMDVVSDADA
jgi:hypothetical protein